MSEQAAKRAKVPSDPRTITLNTGAAMPILGFGTFLSKPGEVGQAVKAALTLGYRHIDCAAVYGNEKEVGAALKEVFDDASNGISREDVFITSKLAPSSATPSTVKEAIQQTLADLQLEYLDLYLIHQPVPVELDPTYDGKHRIVGKFKPLRNVGWGLQDVWRAMETVNEAGLAKAVGVSNFPIALLNDMLMYAKVIPAVHQCERNPFFQQPELVAFCKRNGIAFTGYAPLGAPGLYGSGKPGPMSHAVVKELAAKYSKTPAQILIRWALDTGTISIPKSVKQHRIQENGDVFDFALTEEDVAALAALDDRKGRLFMQDWHSVSSFL